jgi:hypothetical protein
VSQDRPAQQTRCAEELQLNHQWIQSLNHLFSSFGPEATCSLEHKITDSVPEFVDTERIASSLYLLSNATMNDSRFLYLQDDEG